MNDRIRSNATWGLALIALTVGVLGAASPASAASLFDNGGPDRVTGLFATPLDLGMGFINFRAADDFMLDSTSDVDHIRWWGGYAGNVAATPDAFTIEIYSDLDGRPDHLSPTIPVTFSGEVMRKPIGDPPDADGLDLYKYWVDIEPLTLKADTTYWLAIFNDTPDQPWFWASSKPGEAADTSGEGNPWGLRPIDLAFGIHGEPVPEPSSALVFGLGCLIVAGRTRRRPLR